MIFPGVLGGLILLGSGGTARGQEFKKTVDRAFPVFFYCPIDPGLTLSFTAAGSEAILKVTASNFSGASYNGTAFDNIAVVPQSVFQSHQVVTPGYESCYVSPGTANTPGYDFAAPATTETFLDLFDANAARWTLGPFGYFSSSAGAPRDPETGLDTGGGALGLGHPGDGAVSMSASTLVTGLVPGQPYVVTGWWYTQNLSPIEISVNFSVPVTLNVSGVSFAPQTTGTDFASNGIGSLNGAGTFTAPLQLSSGSILKSLAIVAEIFDTTPAVTGRIMRVDTTVFGSANPAPIASVNITGSTGFVSQTATVAIPDIPIDLSRYYYYLAIQQDISVNTLGMRLVYQPPAPGASATTGVAALSFDAERGGVDFKAPQNGTLTSTGAASPGKFIAPARLPQGATVTSLALTARDNAATDVTARLVRVAANATAGTTMAQVSSSGAGTAVRTFTTSTISNAVIDNSLAYDYLELDTPSSQNVYGVQVVYSNAPVAPGFTADALAAAPFVAEDSSVDQRAPVNNALAGQYRFDMGLDLRDGRQMSGFSMSVYDNSPDLGMTAFLYKVDTTVSSFVGPQLIARLESTGQVDGERVFSTDALPGHVIDLQHYFYYVQLYTGLDPVRADGVTVTYLPCGDNDGDGFDGCVDDCIDTRAAVHPGAAEVCDGVVDNCSSPNWPDPFGTIEADDDFDGFSECQGDCADSDSSRWSPPSEAQNLLVDYAPGTGIATVTWTAPANTGGTAAPIYDTLRSFSPSNFSTGTGVCAESNGADLRTLFNATTPAVSVGQCLFLLVRAEAACGMGPLGTSSAGVPLTGRTCP